MSKYSLIKQIIRSAVVLLFFALLFFNHAQPKDVGKATLISGLGINAPAGKGVVLEPKHQFYYVDNSGNIAYLVESSLDRFEFAEPAEGLTKVEFSANEVIVKFKQSSKIKSEGEAKTYLNRLASRNPALARVDSAKKVLRGVKPNSFGLERIFKVTYSRSVDVLRQVRELKKDSAVEYAEPNFVYRTTLTPNDPYFGLQWAHQNMQSEAAWDTETGSDEVVIAIVDSGIDYTHEDLANNMWVNGGEIPGNGVDDEGNGFIDDYYGYDFKNDDGDPFDDYGHGTHVAGIAAAVTNNSVGVAGTCWNCRVMAVKFMGAGGSGYTTDAVNGIYYAVDNGAHIINNSWGCLGDGCYSQALEDGINYAYSQGAFSVAAAGNDNRENTLFYPAAYENVFSVAATDEGNYKAWFSNYGSWVDVAAPGSSIYASVPRGSCALCDASGYMYLSGTSMASPHVAGLAGLLKSRHPGFTNLDFKNILRTEAPPPAEEQYYIGTGIVNSFKSINRDSILYVNLNSANDGVVIRDASILNVIGQAYGEGFSAYFVSIGEGVYPNEWNTLVESSTPVEQDTTIAQIDTSRLNDGVHTIKLTGLDGVWQQTIDMQVFEIDNVFFTSPPNNDIFRGGDVIELEGTIQGSGFVNYIIEHSTEGGQWSSEGVTLVNGGQSQIINGTLGYWNTSSITGAEEYTVRLTVNFENGSTEEFISVYLDPTLKEGWPLRVEGDYDEDDGHYISPGLFKLIASDLDKDGRSEIIFPTAGNVLKLHVLNDDGTPFGDWPISLPDAGGILSTSLPMPVLGDIDNDGFNEILEVNLSSDNKLYAFNHDGSMVPGFPVELPYKDMGGWYAHTILASLALKDLDKDGDLEIVVYSSEPGYLAVYSNSGELLPGWPAFFDDLTSTNLKSNPAIGNLDNDESLEIVIIYNDYPPLESYLDAFNLDGTRVGGWPVVKNNFLYNSPAIGDIDNDGEMEVAVAYRDSLGLFVFNSQGNVESGWPQLQGLNIYTSPVLIDLDNDGDLEIVISTKVGSYGYTHVFKSNGWEYEGWPQHKPFTGYWYAVNVTSPIATKNENGVGMIFEVAGNYLYGWDHQSNPLSVFPKISGNRGMIEYSISAVDIDNDNKLELIGGARPPSTEVISPPLSYVLVWETELSYSNDIEWPMFQHDVQRTGLYVKTPPGGGGGKIPYEVIPKEGGQWFKQILQIINDTLNKSKKP